MKNDKSFKYLKTILARTFLLSLALSLSLSLSSCGSTGNVETAKAAPVEDFTIKHLSNEIPVVFKQNRGSKIVVFRLVFEGGTSALDSSMSGLEDLTLNLALRASDMYSYEDIQHREYEKSFSLSSSSGKDYSTAGFICIQRDLSEVFNIFSSCMLNPLFSEEDYSRRMNEIADEISRKNADPSGTLGLAITKNVFKDHPYGTAGSVTEDSYKNLTLNLVKGLHTSLMNALRIKIVVVGNFSAPLIDDFTEKLERKFGGISRKAFSLPRIAKISVNNEAIRIANEQAGETGYVAGMYSCPSRDSDEYIPYAIASMFIDDLLYAQVREQAGAVYSINTGVLGGKEFVGVISAYRVSGREQFKKLILNAISSFDEEAVEKKLDQYKNKYISSIFNSSQTASGVAANVINSMEYYGSEQAYLHRSEAIRAVQPAQVINAYKKYFEPVAKENAALWIIVDREENLSEYDF